MKKKNQAETTITLLFSGAEERRSFKVSINEKDKIRKTIAPLIKRLNNLPDYVGEYGGKQPLIVGLREDSAKKNAGFGIQYGLNRDGSLRRLDWEDSLYHDWTYGEIKELKITGVIDGNVDHIIVEFPQGLGAAGGSGLNWDLNSFLSLIESIITAVQIGLGIIEKIKIRHSIRTVRKNGFESPEDIRIVIQRKDTWTLQRIRKLFKADDILAAAYLMGLGYINNGKYWKYDDKNPDSLKARAKWLEDEKKFSKEMQNKMNR